MSDLHGIGQPKAGTSVRSTSRTAPGGKAVSVSSSGTAGASRAVSSRTAGLSSGQTISGKIVSISDDSNGHRTAQVDLSGRGTVQASLQDGMGLREGQTISFEVRSNSGRELTLSPLLENTAVDPTTLKALTAAGLSVTNDSVAMVREMMNAGMNVDRSSLLSMSYTLGNNPGVDIQTLVQLQKLNIPITDENIRQYESYRNYEHQLLGTMNEIMDSLPDAVLDLASTGDNEALSRLFDGLMEQALYGAADGDEILTAEVPPDMGSESVPGGASTVDQTTENAAVTDGDIPVLADEALSGEALSNEVTPDETPPGETVRTASGETVPADPAPVGEQSTAAGSGSAAADNVNREARIVFSDEDLEDDHIPDTDRSSPETPRPVFAGAGSRVMIPSGTFSESFVNTLKQMGMKGEMIDRLTSVAADSEIDRDALLKELSENIHDPSRSFEESGKNIARLFRENDFNELLKASMTDRMTMEPSQVAEKENVERFYRQLAEQSEKLSHTLSSTLGAESKPAQGAAALSSGVDFMNQLNQMFNYVQLPLKTADGQAEGDLYVYANKKKRFRPGEPVNAVLHLDMNNMGPVDVFVQMTNNKVRTNFYVADESTIDLINAHIDELNRRLEKRGYQMTTRLALHTDMDDPSRDPAVDAMLDLKSQNIISFTSFDARA